MVDRPRTSHSLECLSVFVGLLVTVVVLTPMRAGADRHGGAALGLLRRSARAAGSVSYRGEQFVSAWHGHTSNCSLVHVTHRAGVGSTLEVADTDSDPHPAAYTMPDAQQRRAPLGGLAGPSSAQLPLLRANYAVGMAGAEQVAGRRTHIVEIRRRAHARPVARLWIDDAHRLVLRREIYGPRGRVAHASAFIDVRFVPVHGGATTAVSRPWGDRLDRHDLASLRRHGWTAPARLPGGMRLFDARREYARSGQVVQLGYTDGLFAISVFVQRGRLSEHRMANWHRARVDGQTRYVRDAMQRQLVWSARGHVYTVFTDTSPAALNRAVGAFPRQQQPGFWRRIASGLSRVGSWINPF